MRIISQIVPTGNPVATNIEATRQPGQTSWELQTWGRPLALGVYPLFVTKDKSLIPLGNTFCISKLGLSLTALHHVREAVRRHFHEDVLSPKNALPTDPAVENIGMTVFHHRVSHRKTLSGYLLDLKFTAASLSTDVCYVFPQFQSGLPYLPLPVTFATPVQGDRVVCVGYSNVSLPDGGLLLNQINSGRLDLLALYERRLRAVEGRVTQIFSESSADGNITGPCFSIDTSIESGMTGGPVFSDSGYVCGIISAEASNASGTTETIISLLRPALSLKIALDGQVGSVRITSDISLSDLIAQGSVITDGTERSSQP